MWSTSPILFAATFAFATGLASHRPSLASWACTLVVVSTLRVMVCSALLRGREHAAFRRRLFIGSMWCSGLLLGFAADVTVTDAPLAVVAPLTILQVVIVMTIAARNAACALGTTGLVLFALLPLAFMTAAGAPMLSAAIAFAVIATLTLVLSLADRKITVLRAEQERADLIAALRAANSELESQALTDGLTGLANRRRFDEALAASVRQAQRDDEKLSLLMIDIDRFKAYNDRFGHYAGDQCLRAVSAVLAAGCRRPGDVVARYGGEEFAAILPRTALGAASAIAEALRADVAALGIGGDATGQSRVTVSIGVTAYAGHDRDAVAPMLQRADGALYDAKAAGRDCVRVASALSSIGLSNRMLDGIRHDGVPDDGVSPER